MSPRKQSSVPEINIGDTILVESLQEFLEESQLVEEYIRLKDKCDTVITKIKTRKRKQL